MIWPDGNDASVEIRKKGGFPPPLGKVSPKSGSTFPHFHRPYGSLFFEKQENRNGHTEGKAAPEKNDVAHPAPNPVLECFAKSFPCGKEAQDAIEDYSESGPKVQVLCV